MLKKSGSFWECKVGLNFKTQLGSSLYQKTVKRKITLSPQYEEKHYLKNSISIHDKISQQIRSRIKFP